MKQSCLTAWSGIRITGSSCYERYLCPVAVLVRARDGIMAWSAENEYGESTIDDHVLVRSISFTTEIVAEVAARFKIKVEKYLIGLENGVVCNMINAARLKLQLKPVRPLSRFDLLTQYKEKYE